MTTKRQSTAHIKNQPEAVLAFIADVRNRTRYLPSLKSLTEIKGEPAAVGTTWKWKYAVLGHELEGTGRSVAYETGKRYSFTTEGGVQSTWIYRVEPDGDGTQLSVDVEFQLPEALKAKLPPAEEIDALMKAEGEQVINRLKAILEH